MNLLSLSTTLLIFNQKQLGCTSWVYCAAPSKHIYTERGGELGKKEREIVTEKDIKRETETDRHTDTHLQIFY
jgi:hypothetical protein